MKKTSIKTAILIPSIAILTAGITIMVIIAGMLSGSSVNELTSKLIESRVQEQAREFEIMCGGVYDAVSAITPSVANYADQSYTADISNPREKVIDILSKTLMTNEKIIAIWTCWEPNAFDGKDSDYANASFYDKTGRFVPYLYKSGANYELTSLLDYDDPTAGDYYQGALTTGKPHITDPYAYLVGNTETTISSIAIPIIMNGKAVGVVGADVDLQEFISVLEKSKIIDGGYMFALSPSGLYAAHAKKELLSKSYTTTWMNGFRTELENLFNNGGSLSVTDYSDVINEQAQMLGIGVKIGDTGRYWYIGGVVPVSAIQNSSVSLMITITIMGVLLILIVGAVIFLLVHNNLKKLPMLTKAAEAIALGDVNIDAFDMGTDATGNEIILLERAFYKMADGINNQAEIMSCVANGDYSVKVPIRSERDVMSKAMDNMLIAANDVLNQINSSANQVFAGSRQVADSAQSLATGASEQASSIEELSESINNITSKTDENAKVAREAAALFKNIMERAEKGNVQMEQMMQAVNEINEASTQIETVIKAIDDIAFQTNILALNAAVEAARAGQHGKGFAVVAEEVRNLAAKSAESASNTGEMLANSKAKANLGLVIAEETTKSLKEIIEGITRSADIATQIELAASEQANAISRINAGIEQVSSVIQQNSTASEESAAASEEMNGQSALLAELIAQFKLRQYN